MNKIFLLVLRAILALLVMVNIYIETGVFTTLGFLVLCLCSEIDFAYRRRSLNKLDEIQRHLQAYKNQSISDKNELIRMMDDTLETIRRIINNPRNPNSIPNKVNPPKP